jgi:hypothetical protein
MLRIAHQDRRKQILRNGLSPMVAWWPSSKAERGHHQVFAGF